MQTFKDFERLLAIKRYSPNTIKAYIGLLRTFSDSFQSQQPIHEMERRDLLNGVIKIVESRSYRYATQKQLLSALTLYLSEVHGRQFDFGPVYPTRRPSPLPEILSLVEVKAILDSLKNLKHRTMLTMVYALGLRSGELISMKVPNVDGSRKTVHIKAGKGAKDRVLPLPAKLLRLLREYFRQYRPETFLFEGQARASYSPQSLRKVFQAATAKAGIQKKVTLHSLRHAYATHLLEAGTSIRVIQELLGHTSIKTTMLYTHVAQANVVKVKSPLELL